MHYKTTAFYALKCTQKFIIYIFVVRYSLTMSHLKDPEIMFRKIVEQVCEIYHGKRKHIYLGNIKSKIDGICKRIYGICI